MPGNGPGFYRADGSELFHSMGPAGPGYTLYWDQRLTYTYPIDGWRLFDSEEEARTFYGLPPLPLDWAPNTVFAAGDKVRTENGRLLLVVTPGTTAESMPDGPQMQFINDGSVQFAYIGDFYG